MNIVLIMTDTQPTSMVGCYSGNPMVGTPNLDRLASQGIRFDRAYTACPLCTPARSALFTGQHPQVNGAWANSMAPGINMPLMGTIFSDLGYRCAYSGKWHLDGTSYFGDGEAGGGFAQDWWFDGKNYADFLGPELFETYRTCKTSDGLRAAGFDLDKIWGHQVANRAIDFLEENRDRKQPFLLVASFDEPHGPYIAPPDDWDSYDAAQIPIPENFQAPLLDKPALQSLHASQVEKVSAEVHRESKRHFYACNRFVDREIGRVLDAVDRLHGEDTVVIYTSDHGDMQRSHGLIQKGPMMYEEVIRIPFIVRHPGGARGRSCRELVSQVDILPTLLELTGQTPPGILHGRSFLDQLKDPDRPGCGQVLVSFVRFALNHDGWGGFYPIRCLVTQDHKLAVNLLDTDELYSREEDPLEVRNLIDDPRHAGARDRLHDLLLEEMNRIRDPFRGAEWGDRAWRRCGVRDYYGGKRRNRPSVFPFQAPCLDSDGTWSAPEVRAEAASLKR